MKYTFLYYKKDLHGERIVNEIEFDMNPEILDQIVEYANSILKSDEKLKDVRLEVVETFVTSRNYMTGEYFQERYDTPYFASPRSETFWSN